jgi:YidC/Oxa1 family membrane protein insertase
MLVDANIFQPLIDVFQAVLVFFHDHLALGWGVSIVLLTVVIRALMVPLTLKQFHSMQRLQRLQPQMKAIQQKYKDDKQRQQQEIMKFYKENQVNPFGSCAPLALQLPVFISLFYMLRSSLRHDICPQLNPLHAAHTVPCGPHGGAGFLFIPDLTNSAHGAVLVVLILLYVGSQLASTLMMSAPGMDQNQRRLMMFMPVFFVIFVIKFPAGVLVYWITTNTWTMAQQYFVRRRLGPVTPVPAGGPVDSTATAVGAGSGTAKTTPRDGAQPENGAGAGGLAGLIKGRLKPADEATKEPAAVATRARGREGPPPPPPRKKKKRSGRRR